MPPRVEWVAYAGTGEEGDANQPIAYADEEEEFGRQFKLSQQNM